MGFTKLDEEILKSSIMTEDSDTFKIWITLLAACKEDGVASVSPVFIESICRLPINTVLVALEKLSSPDALSRSTNDDGRRIERVDGGYKIINYEKYRSRSLKSAEAERKRLYRANGSSKKEGFIYYAESSSRIKIGFSVNPWARVNDLKTAAPDIFLLCVVKGTLNEESKIHDKFSHINIGGEWFKKSDDLMDFIKATINSSPDSSASASASASEDKKDSKEEKIRNQIPPSIESIVEYCNQRQNNIVPQKFFDHYQSKGWMVGRTKMKDWQAAIRTWESSGFNDKGSTKTGPKNCIPLPDQR